MKKKVLSVFILSAFLFSSCSKEELPAETLESIYVDRDDLLYAENEIIETIAATTTIEDTAEETTTTAEETTTAPEVTVAPTPTTTAVSFKPYTPNNKTVEYKESVYNTTVDNYIKETELAFDKIEVYAYDEVEEYFTIEEIEVDLGEFGKQTIQSEVPVPRFGVTHDVNIVENMYYLYRLMFGRNQYLEATGKEPVIFDIRKDDDNPYEFLFRGIEHQYSEHYYKLPKDENGEEVEYTQEEKLELYGTYDDGKVYFELQDMDKSIYLPKGFERLRPKDYDTAKVKAMATRLPNFTKLDGNGNAILYKDMYIYYRFKINDKENNQEKDVSLSVGMTMQSIYDLIGEGTIIEGTNILKEKGSERGLTEDVTEEVKLHVYKTKDFTLVIEEKEFPDIKPDERFVDVPEETILANTIILIQNSVDFSDLEEEMALKTETVTSETTVAAIPEEAPAEA